MKRIITVSIVLALSIIAGAALWLSRAGSETSDAPADLTETPLVPFEPATSDDRQLPETITPPEVREFWRREEPWIMIPTQTAAPLALCPVHNFEMQRLTVTVSPLGWYESDVERANFPHARQDRGGCVQTSAQMLVCGKCNQAREAWRKDNFPRRFPPLDYTKSRRIVLPASKRLAPGK